MFLDTRLTMAMNPPDYRSSYVEDATRNSYNQLRSDVGSLHQDTQMSVLRSASVERDDLVSRLSAFSLRYDELVDSIDRSLDRVEPPDTRLFRNAR